MKTNKLSHQNWLGSCSKPLMKMLREKRPAHLQSALLVFLLSMATVPSALAGSVTPVATGLNNPRGLAFGAIDGHLYVAEAGLGAGDGKGGFAVGIGFTGSISEILNPASPNPTVQRVVTELASVGDTNFGFPEVQGADGISVLGKDKIFVIMAESSQRLNLQPTDPAATQFGHLLKANTGGTWQATADVGNFDYIWTSQNQNLVPGQFPDANPYGVLALLGRQYVADAGSNTLDEVRPNGTVRIVAFLPNPPSSDAVSTCVAKGPDGFLYVGTLGALVPGQGQVFRINPLSQQIQHPTYQDAWASGFNGITGCGFGPGGFYVTEFTAGDVVKIAINSDGTAGASTQLGLGALTQPNGFAVGPDGAIYVSNFSTSSGGGMVVRVNN